MLDDSAKWMRTRHTRRKRQEPLRNTEIEGNARDYFQDPTVSLQSILLRLPEGQLADPLSVVDRSFFELRGTRFSTRDEWRRLTLSRELLARTSRSIHMAQFDTMGESASERYHDLPEYLSLVMFAFVSAFLGREGGSNEELNFLHLLETIDVADGDIPHFTHLTEELAAVNVPGTIRLPVMLRLYGLHELNLRMAVRDNFREAPKVFPVFRARQGMPVSKLIFDRAIPRLANVMQPRISLVSQNSEVVGMEQRPREEVFKLVEAGNWEQLLRTKMADGDAPLALMHHAMALFKLEKYCDLVEYCSKCYAVSRANVFLYMRAAAWLMLDMRDFCQADLAAVSPDTHENEMQQAFGEKIIQLATDKN